MAESDVIPNVRIRTVLQFDVDLAPDRIADLRSVHFWKFDCVDAVTFHDSGVNPT